MSVKRWGAALVGLLTVSILVLAFALGHSRTGPHLPGAMPIDDLSAWEYAGGGLVLKELKIDADPGANAPPQVSVRATNGSDQPLIFGLFVVFLDKNGELVTVAALSPPNSGIIRSKETLPLSVTVMLPRTDIAAVRHFAVRVTRAKVFAGREGLQARANGGKALAEHELEEGEAPGGS